MRVHPSRCEDAAGRECECGHCGGTLHAWPGLLEIARGVSETTAAGYRALADSRWLACGGGVSTVFHEQAGMAAAVDSAVADLVDRLAGDGETAGRIEELGRFLHAAALPEVRVATGLPPTAAGKALADHLFCDVLAAVVHTWDGGTRGGHAVAAVQSSRRVSGRPPIERAAVRLAAGHAEAGLSALAEAAGTQPALRAVRILAVFLCPAPEVHRAVTSRCLAPLVHGLVSPGTMSRLADAFPGDWLPGALPPAGGPDEWRPLRLHARRLAW